MVGEEAGAGEEAGGAHGLVMGHSAIYRHGRDPDGYLEEDRAGGYSVAHGDTGLGLGTPIQYLIHISLQLTTRTIHGDGDRYNVLVVLPTSIHTVLHV